MIKKQYKNDATFNGVVKRCIELLGKMRQHEENQILLAHEIGKEVDTLLKNNSENNSIIIRLSREIVKQTGKFYQPNKFIQYRQLYLNFENAENIIKQTKIINEIDIDILLKIFPINKNIQNGISKKDINIFILTIKKIERLVNKLYDLINKKPPVDEEIDKIIERIETINKKMHQVTEIIKNKSFQTCLYK